MSNDFKELIKGKEKQELKSEFPPFFVFEESGDFIAGTVSNPREIETEYGIQKLVTVTTREGEAYTVGLTAQLAPLYNMNGREVVVVYRGLEKLKGKGRYIKRFEIYV